MGTKITVSEAAAFVGFSKSTLYRHIKSGKLAAETDESGQQRVDTSELSKTYSVVAKTADPPSEQLKMDELVRASVISPAYFRTPTNEIVVPDETKYSSSREISIEDLIRFPDANAVKYLIKKNDSLRFAVDTHVDYTVNDFTIDAEDERDYEIINTYINGFPNGRAGYLGYLKQLAYGRYVEGGIGSELINDDMGMPIKSVYVSPWTLAAELREDPVIGEYYVYGQRQRDSNFELRVLFDEANPMDNGFVFLPAHQTGDDPFGGSQVTPALFSILSMQDLLFSIVNFTKGQVFPKHIYSVDTKSMADAGYTPAQITAAANLATDLITSTLDAADITEDVVLSVPIVATLVGALERAGIDGAEMILDIFERMQQRGLKVPRVLYGGRRQTGVGLNDNESRVEWFSFFKRLFSGMTDIEAVEGRHYDSVLMAYGSTGKASLKLDRSDPELARYSSELFKMQLEGFTAMAELKVGGVHAFTVDEIRRKVIESNPEFNDLDFDLPEELMKQKEVMAQMPAPNEPATDDEPMDDDPEADMEE